MKNKENSMKDIYSILKGSPDLVKDMAMSGFIAENDIRSGSYLMRDGKSVGAFSEVEGLVVRDIKDAIVEFPFVKKYMWSLVDKNKDEYTKKVSEEINGGYFVHVKKGAKIELPLQSCLLICSKDFEQKVHNIIILEEDSELKIITGCLQHNSGHAGSHLGISEIFVGKNAKLNFTMVHNWNEEMFVRPRTGINVEESGEFVSNYVLLNPVKDIQMYPFAKLADNAKASFNGIIYASKNSIIDSGAKIEFNGKNTFGEIISRVVTIDNSKVYSRGLLLGNNSSKGHMECNAIILNKGSSVIAVPEIIANSNEAELSHEAAVGKIADKEIFYLMTRGLSENDAVSTIVRGFMDVGFFGLPEHLEKNIQKVVDEASKGF